MAEQKKTLGQIAYEVMYHGHYPAVDPAEQARWEAVGQAVRAAVLAEQGAPQGPVGMAEQERRTRRAIGYAVATTARDCSAADGETLIAAIEEGVLAGLKEWEQWR